MHRAAVFLMMLTILYLSSCSRSTGASRSLQQHGLDLVGLIAQMATSETYIKLVSASDEQQEILAQAGGGNYSQPAAIYQITLSRKSPLLDMMLAGVGGSLSQPLEDHLATRVQASMATQINGMLGGARTLVAASLCSAGKTFVYPQLTEATSYLYTFEQGIPALISFIPGEDGSVSASGSFIFSEELADKAILQQLKDSIASIAEIQELSLENR